MQPDPPTASPLAPSTGATAGSGPHSAAAQQQGHDTPARGPWARHLLVLLPLLFLLLTGLRGLDFGRHWDEPIQIENMHTAIESQTLLPKWYRYPSMLFWMTVGSLSPEILADLPTDGEEMRALQARLSATVDSQPFRLRTRTLFLFVTCLTVLWTYLLALAWRGSSFEALIAASCIGLSWEIAYHARWIAPDGILMQFSALTLLLVVHGVSRRDGRWLAGAALVAGLGCGTKYTGGILLLPVLIAGMQLFATRSITTRLRVGAGLAGLFLLAFVLSTPGAVLQPFVFLRHLGFEIEHYRTGHYGATIDAGLPHLLAILRYVGAHLFSQQNALAIAVTACAVLGFARAVRRTPGSALLLAALPATYLLYMSTQRVMFVRNLLLVAPVLAVFAARGATQLFAGGSRTDPESGTASSNPLPAYLLLALLWIVNGSFVYHASQTIHGRDQDDDVRAFSAWAGEHPEQRLFISGRLARNLERLALPLPTHAVRERDAAVDGAAFYPGETDSGARLLANRPGTCIALFGPLDVNFDYYPAWQQPKIVVYPPDAARAAGILAGE